jgi:hypothetical protein
MCDNYEGWTNRETWALVLHLDNDQTLHEAVYDYTDTALEEHKEEDSREALLCHCLSETLRMWIEEDLLTFDNIKGNHSLWLMLTDIGSLYRVNWREVADYFLAGLIETRQSVG